MLILGKLKFSIRPIKKLKALLHWEQDFRRISEQLSVEGNKKKANKQIWLATR